MKGRDLGIEKGPFADAKVISSYSREQALEDGVLVDLSEWAREVGFRCSVVCTTALWAKIEAPKRSTQDTRGRAHDVLWLAACEIKRCRSRAARLAPRTVPDDLRVTYRVRLGRKNERLVLVLDGGGATIGFPEDF